MPSCTSLPSSSRAIRQSPKRLRYWRHGHRAIRRSTEPSVTSACDRTGTISTSSPRGGTPTISRIPTLSLRHGSLTDEVEFALSAAACGVDHRCCAEAGRNHRCPDHRKGRDFGGPGMEPLPRRNVRHRSHGLHAAPRGDGPHAVPEVCTRPRSSTTAGESDTTSTSTTTRSCPPRSRRSTGMTRRSGGSSAQIAATRCGRSSSLWARVPSTGRNCLASRESRPSRAIRSTPAAGTTSTRRQPCGGLMTGWPTSGSASRDRRHVGAVHPAPLRSRRRVVRVPTDAFVDRHPQQPRHRPRVVRRA